MPVPFLIVTTQRSGSTMLGELLNSHPRIQCDQEIFLRENDTASGFTTYRTGSLRRRVKHLFRRREQIFEYLENFMSAPETVEAIGFKFMYDQASMYPEVIDWAKENQVKIIHLIRSNALKMIVSRNLARARKVYHSERPLARMMIELSSRHRARDLGEISEQVEEFRRTFAGYPYAEITYEGLVVDREKEMRSILDFLGIDDFAHLTTHMVKISPDSLQESVANYDEVARLLKGTVYERFLD